MNNAASINVIRERITALTRVAIGKIRLGDLPVGKHRHLTEAEISYLKGN